MDASITVLSIGLDPLTKRNLSHARDKNHAKITSKFMKISCFPAALLLALLATSVALAGPITSVVAYGDSYSDNGNLGRESNGPVIVEQLAADLGLPLIDHAWVGATTGIGNLSDGGGLTYLGSQGYPGMTTSVDADLAKPPVNPASALYVVWGGHNDILVNGQDQGPQNIANIVVSLQAAGATHILVPGVMDLGLTPFGSSSGTPQQFTTISNTFNAQLRAILPAGVTYIDAAGILRNIVVHPAQYGLTNVTDACSFPTLCEQPDKYLFWDSFHPTTRADTIFAADFAAAVTAVPEPSAFFVIAGSLLLLGMVRSTKRKPSPKRFELTSKRVSCKTLI